MDFKIKGGLGDLRIIVADGVAEVAFLEALKARQFETDRVVSERVSGIIEAVRLEGDVAVARLTAELDGCLPDSTEVSREAILEALSDADPLLVGALNRAKENIGTYHQRQVKESFLDAQPNGVILGQRVRGLERVGIYVPGGTAAYPSSVLMNAIPAKIAGVGEIVMVTPPTANGGANPDILTAAAIAGVDRVFLMGGAQAVAALAFGTKSVPRVDKIVGPGNIYVATAKKQLYGVVDIDMIAGPSEILIIAEAGSNPVYIAADLMSQAEHDVLAGAILLTNSMDLAKQVEEELKRQMAMLSRKGMIEEALANFGAIIVFKEIDEMLLFADAVAPEHLEVMLADPLQYVGRINNAGSVFLGEFAPEPVGDYYAGPNHVLPTGGTARFFSPLSVDSFVKKSSFTYYTKEALAKGKDDIILIAEKEGLSAHANAIKVRF